MLGNYNNRKYSYPLSLKIPIFLGVILITLSMFWLVAVLSINLIYWAMGQSVDIVSTFIGIILAVTIFGSLVVSLSNFFPDIQVFDQGLKVQVYLFWWVTISWEDIINLQPALGGLSQSCLVVVRKLTPFHRLIGGSYSGFKPAFIIRPTLDGFDELIRLIKSNIGQVM